MRITPITSTPGTKPPEGSGSASDEVRALQTEIGSRAKLSRQQIARAAGVDRRSLSGWANGTMNPSPERLAALRVLAEIVRDIDSIRPGGAREVLLARPVGRNDLLDDLAAGRFDLASRWRNRQSTEPTVTQAQRAVTASNKPPLWAAAVEALAAGRLHVPTRSRQIRPDETYEIDPEDAHLFVEPGIAGPRRAGYR